MKLTIKKDDLKPIIKRYIESVIDSKFLEGKNITVRNEYNDWQVEITDANDESLSD